MGLLTVTLAAVAATIGGGTYRGRIELVVSKGCGGGAHGVPGGGGGFSIDVRAINVGCGEAGRVSSAWSGSSRCRSHSCAAAGWHCGRPHGAPEQSRCRRGHAAVDLRQRPIIFDGPATRLRARAGERGQAPGCLAWRPADRRLERMPELPEAERARQQIERVLDREIVAVDDRDMYVCRPHAPGEIAAALVGRRLTKAHRRGKFLWVETGDGGPELGLHLGMAGRIAVDEEPAPRQWDRFALEFADGGRMALRDKRRLGRALIEPDFSHVGPDAAEVGRDGFRERVGRGILPLKAKLLDQGVIAGVGNLLADETLWRARLSPRRPAGELSADELDHLRRELRAAVRDAIRNGGVHTGRFMPAREKGGCARAARRCSRGTRSAGAPRTGARVCQPALGVIPAKPRHGVAACDPRSGLDVDLEHDHILASIFLGSYLPGR